MQESAAGIGAEGEEPVSPAVLPGDPLGNANRGRPSSDYLSITLIYRKINFPHACILRIFS